MFLNSLKIDNYKNLEKFKLNFNKKINCFIGKNGIGNYKSAINFLNRIKDDFPDSYESGLVEVQLGRIENLNN